MGWIARRAVERAFKAYALLLQRTAEEMDRRPGATDARSWFEQAQFNAFLPYSDAATRDVKRAINVLNIQKPGMRQLMDMRVIQNYVEGKRATSLFWSLGGSLAAYDVAVREGFIPA